jgi:hypothetical protein
MDKTVMYIVKNKAVQIICVITQRGKRSVNNIGMVKTAMYFAKNKAEDIIFAII